MDYTYPEEEQRFFANREHPLAVLGLSRDLLVQGVRKHLALSGFRRLGKTVVVKEFSTKEQIGILGTGELLIFGFTNSLSLYKTLTIKRRGRSYY